MPAVGASGAIFGLGGMLAVITPQMPVYILFIPIAMPMWLGVIISLALLWILSVVAGLPIGNLAHLGGLLAGLVYAFYLRKKYRRFFDIVSNHFR
jgi:membrane associated rhomboid family serine protease